MKIHSTPYKRKKKEQRVGIHFQYRFIVTVHRRLYNQMSTLTRSTLYQHYE